MISSFGAILARDAAEVLSRVSLAPLQGRRVLVTGASGFLGTNVLACVHEARVKHGVEAEVFAVVRSDLPEFLRPLVAELGARVLCGDLTESSFRKTLPTADCVIHAACYAQPARFMSDPVETLALGTEVTLDLLRRTSPGSPFLFVSSSEIYSGLTNPPFRESQTGTTDPSHPRACYIEGKRAGEALCHAFRGRGLAARVIRVALAYGPGTRRGDQRVLNTFVESALLRGEIAVRDEGRATRTYAYVSDVVELLWQVLLYGKEAVYNVGGESSTTISELARTIGSLTSARVRFPETPAGVTGAPDDVRLDLSKVGREFGKRRFVALEAGLRRTIEWQRALLAAT